MPKLAEEIDVAVETSAKFAKRRLEWAVRYCSASNERLPFYKFEVLVGVSWFKEHPAKLIEAYERLHQW